MISASTGSAAPGKQNPPSPLPDAGARRDEDKTGGALVAQRFRMLEDIARELSGDVAFPTFFDVSMQLRRVLRDPNQSIDQICAVIIGDPLICSKLLSLANSVIYNPQRAEIRDIKAAVQRLGLNAVRNAAMAAVMKQILLSRGVIGFTEFTKNIWTHSISTASAAYVVARRLSRISPDDALLAGLVHDIGVFYMLYRASQYEELRARPVTLKYLAMQWHESIGETLLNALGVPESISTAIRDHDQSRPVPPLPASLSDVVYVANILAGGPDEWFLQDMAAADEKRNALNDGYLSLLPEIQEHAAEMRSIFF